MSIASKSRPFNLRRERLARGLSIRALAAELGMSDNTVRRIEEGDASARPATAKLIADHFGVQVIDVAPQLFEEAA